MRKIFAIICALLMLSSCKATEPKLSGLPETENQTMVLFETESPMPPKATSEPTPDEPTSQATKPSETQSDMTETAGHEEATTGLSGYHTKTYDNGDVYEGYYENGQRSGQGKYTWANGIVYIGEFVKGDPSGNGEYIYPDPPTQEPTPPPSRPATNETQPPPSASVASPTELIVPNSKPDNIDLQDGAVPLSDTIPEPYGYFGNIIFLGDSMTTGFDLYRGRIKYEGKDVLRDTSVVAVISYGVNNALAPISNKSIHPLFSGEQTKPEDIIAQKEAKYVFVCLGINDIIWQSTEGFVNSYSRLVGNIKEKSPEKAIVIMSLTPVVAGQTKSKLTNEKIMEANAMLLAFAKENGIPFIDYAAALRDEQDSLPTELSSDAYCHFTIDAYEKLVEYMLCHPVS